MKFLAPSFLLLFTAMTYSLAQSPDSVYYELWDISNLELIGGHSLTILGDPQVVATEIGDAVQFDGEGDRILVDFNPVMDAKEFTVELVFKPDACYPDNTDPRFVHIQDPDDPDEKRIMIIFGRDSCAKPVTGARNVVSRVIARPTMVIFRRFIIVFSIRTIRKDQWKLYVESPRFYHPPDLENWVDKRAPDGVTIIAPYEQVTPAQYPGIKPMKMDGESFLFNLEKDVAEMDNVAGDNPEIINALKEEYLKFMNTLDVE